MGTRVQRIWVNGKSRGVLDTLGGRTIRILEPPPEAGSGVMNGQIVESGRMVWLHLARSDDGRIEVRNVFADMREALFYYVGDFLSAAVLEMLTDAEREQAFDAAREAERNGQPGLSGIHSWAQRKYGRSLADVVQERWNQRRQFAETPVPSERVH